MPLGTIIFATLAALATLAAGFAYRWLWLSMRGPELTPTGFGVLLPIVLLPAAFIAGASLELQVALAVTLVAAAAYWLDDVYELSARLRILISFAAGLVIAAVYFATAGSQSLLPVLALCLAGGVASVALTNMANFYDGADLNLATFVALTSGLILLYLPPDFEWAAVALACLAFTAPFALINSRPRTLYLGDSGSFAFAGLLTIIAAAFVEDQALPPESAIPAALPAFDVFFVFAYRIQQKHDLLSRNYLHLYQRLNSRYRGFGYLLPQIVNVALCLIAAHLLQGIGVGRISSVVIVMALVTIPFYFLCRKLFLGVSQEPAPQTGG